MLDKIICFEQSEWAQLEHFLPTCLSVKWYWQSFFHRSRSSVRVPSSGHTWPRLTRSLPSVRHCMMFSCRLAGRSVSAMPVDVGWSRRKKKVFFFFCFLNHECCFTFYEDWTVRSSSFSLFWSGCCPAAAATVWCSPCGAPRCWCCPPARICPCPERGCTATRRASEAALWWAGRSAGHPVLRRMWRFKAKHSCLDSSKGSDY